MSHVPLLTSVKQRRAITTPRVLQALCMQAKCGVKGKTVTDKKVRNTLRAGPEVVSVTWEALGAALEMVQQELLPGTVTATLHDVLLYRKGDFFARHVESKKGPATPVDAGIAESGADSLKGGVLSFGRRVRGVYEGLGHFARGARVCRMRC